MDRPSLISNDPAPLGPRKRRRRLARPSTTSRPSSIGWWIGGLIVATYLLWPYWSLYQLAQALENGDTRVLRTAVDWPTVRANLKSDFQDEIARTTRSPIAGMLAAWALNTTTGAAIDAAVSPTGLMTLWRNGRAGQRPLSAADVKYAFFSGPASFKAIVLVRLQDGAVPVGLHFRIDGWGWVVDRVALTAGSRW